MIITIKWVHKFYTEITTVSFKYLFILINKKPTDFMDPKAKKYIYLLTGKDTFYNLEIISGKPNAHL